jgi:hypothetical protein
VKIKSVIAGSAIVAGQLAIPGTSTAADFSINPKFEGLKRS